MRVDLFDFDLPPERIALEPAWPRDASRLLRVGVAGVTDNMVSDLPDHLRAGDILVLNDTKVIPAQLKGLRPARADGGGGDVTIDVTLHKQERQQNDKARWRAFVRPAKRVRAGDTLNFAGNFFAKIVECGGAEAVLEFNVVGDAFDTALEIAGAPPLPPYIARRRDMTTWDVDCYQTVYAAESGSVAAPTAGLHFTDELLRALRAKGIRTETITLHVGAGTFLPVSAEDTQDHKMHAEWGEITAGQAAQINDARAAGGRIIAVGTTALRLLESAADADGHIRPFANETDIFITPGYRFKTADILLTNFHLPRSTLFMLVCAFAGTAPMKAAYAHAINQAYRFYSYGDACLLERRDG